MTTRCRRPRSRCLPVRPSATSLWLIGSTAAGGPTVSIGCSNCEWLSTPPDCCRLVVVPINYSDIQCHSFSSPFAWFVPPLQWKIAITPYSVYFVSVFYHFTLPVLGVNLKQLRRAFIIVYAGFQSVLLLRVPAVSGQCPGPAQRCLGAGLFPSGGDPVPLRSGSAAARPSPGVCRRGQGRQVRGVRVTWSLVGWC